MRGHFPARMGSGRRCGSPRGERPFVRHEVQPMIVQYEKNISRTCGSARSSLSAPARLATVGSEAAETPVPPLWGKSLLRGRLQTESVNSVQGSGWMTCPTQVNCRSRRQFQGAKDADRLQPKMAMQPVALRNAEHADITAAGGEAGAKSSVSLSANMANLTSRLCLRQAGRSARRAGGMAGRGCWRKRRPLGNRADKSVALPRKRADFQRVIGNEKTGKTIQGGNRK